MTNFKKILTTILVSAILTAVGGYKLYNWLFLYETTNNAYVQTSIVNVTSPLPGIIKQISINNNDYVKKDDLIIKLEEDSLQDNYKQAKYKLEAAKINANITKKKIKALESKRKTLVAAKELSDESFKILDDSLSQLNSSKATKSLVDKAKYQELVLQHKKAKFEKEKASIELAAVDEEKSMMEEGLKAENKNLDSLTETIELSKNFLEMSEIYSNKDGIVTNIKTYPGDYVFPGKTLCSIVSLNNPKIIATFKETQLKNISEGREAEIVLDSYPDVTIKGKVEKINPATDSNFSILPKLNSGSSMTKVMQTVSVELSIEPPESLKNKILPGMSSKVSIKLK